MGTLIQDLRYGIRLLARNPGFSAVAVLTLALGIGVNTAMFSVVNAVLLRPLSYKDPDRLVSIWAEIPSMNISGAFVEYNTFADYWRAGSHSFQSMTAYTPAWVNLTTGGQAERLLACRVNAGFLSMIGVKPQSGREFLPSEDQPGASLESAQAEIDGLCRRWVEATHYPKDWGARVWRLHDYAVRDV